MDSFEKEILRYKEELMKYLKSHPAPVTVSKTEIKQITEDEPENEKTVYNAQYVSNRPMPDEYTADEEAPSPSGSAVTEETEANTALYPDKESFLKENVKSGKLRVQVYASQQVFPISNAMVTVEKDFQDGTHIFAQKYTGIDGIVQDIALPTKDKRLSLTAGNEIPYTTYRIRITHPQFSSLTYEKVPIFDSIESMQPAEMVPKSSSDKAEVISESKRNNVR